MILRELLASTPVFEVKGRRRIDIKGIALRPEDVETGYLYIYSKDEPDLTYEESIAKAKEKGAIAIVVGSDNEIPEDTITYIRTYHYRRFLSAVSRNFYNNPSQTMNLVGITGSHGKTTVGWMIKSILNIAGIPGVMLGTDYCQVGDHTWSAYSGGMNPLTMNRFLHKAVREQVRWGIIECTYTGIVEDQFSHIWYNSIIYTDLYTYFKNQKADSHYFEMRKTLLDHLKTTHSPVIINVDDFYAFHLQRSSTVGYGLFNDATITGKALRLLPESCEFILVTPKGERPVNLNVAGIHNVYNALAAAGWGLAEGLSLDDVVEGIEAFEDMPEPEKQKGISDCIEVKDIMDISLDEIGKVFEELGHRDKGKIVSVLCMDDSEDVGKYKELGNIIGKHGGHCIMIHDYFSHSDMEELERAAAKKMDDIAIYYETDYYKAIQKAVTFLPEGGHILLVRC